MRILTRCATALCVAMAAGAAHAGPSQTIFAYTDGFTNDSVQLVLTIGSGSTTVFASSTGWYDQNGNHDAAITSYLAGVCGSTDSCNGDDLVRHNYLSFLLSPTLGTVTGAQLRIFNPDASTDPGTALPIPPGYISDTASLTYMTYAVAADAGRLAATHTGATDIFADLGAGAVYGAAVVSPADDGAFVTVELTDAAVADLNADIGQTFSVGGVVTPTRVPEPGSLTLIFGGLGVLSVLRRQQARQGGCA